MAHTLLAHSVDKIYKMNKLLSNLPSLHMHNCLMQVKHRPVLVLVQLQLDSVAGRVWRKAPRNHLLSKDYSHKQLCNISYLKYNYQVAFWLLGAGPHRCIRLRFQLWFVHLVPLKSKVFTLSFFGLMHSPLSNSPKREGQSRPQE